MEAIRQSRRLAYFTGQLCVLGPSSRGPYFNFLLSTLTFVFCLPPALLLCHFNFLLSRGEQKNLYLALRCFDQAPRYARGA